MKPCRKLNRADFDTAPVWVWQGDGDPADDHDETDESCVEATSLREIPLHEFNQFIVACTITLADAAEFPGFAEVTVADGRAAVVPVVVFLLDRQLRIPAVETNRLLSRYTKTANHPVAWRLAVPIEHETERRAGDIKGGDMNNVVAVGLELLAALKSLRK